MRQRILITGASGILGSWVLAGALHRGYAPVVLMRDASRAQARRRLEKVLAMAGFTGAARAVDIVLGDVASRHFGLEAHRFHALRSEISLFIHCAASVSFSPKQDRDIWNTNIQGTREVLGFLAGTPIPLYYVGTAYVAGTRSGQCREDELFVGQGFKNAYERSKCHCEMLVRGALEQGLRGAIFRPGIITGATCGGQIVQFVNFYSFLRVVDLALCGRIKAVGSVRFAMNPACTKNLVPVDWAAAALWKVIESAGPCGRAFHLTHPAPISHEGIMRWANRHLEARGLYLECVRELGPSSTPLERMGVRQLRHYKPYLQSEPAFERSNLETVLEKSLPTPPLSPEYFDMLLGYARARGWRKPFDWGNGHAKAAAPGELLVSRVPAVEGVLP